MTNSHEDERVDRTMKLESWLIAGFFSTWCGFLLLFGLFVSVGGPKAAGAQGIELRIGLGMMAVAIGGLAFIWWRVRRGPRTVASLKNAADRLRDQRLELIDLLLAQSPPRQEIPKGFQGAQLTSKTAAIFFLLLLGMFPAWLLFFGIQFLRSGDLKLAEIDFFPLLYGILNALMYLFATFAWAAYIWLRISERRRRRRILRDGHLVSGTLVTVKSCGELEKVLFSAPEGGGTQSRALLEFPWEGETRQAHQFVYDNDENTSFRSLPAGTPVRLLVWPANPKHVIWIEATFLPDPLRDTAEE